MSGCDDCGERGPKPGKSRYASTDPGPVIALLGRPNVGKTSLYNRLTGADAHVGNYPGVTVDLLEADVQLPDGPRATITDLPGVYSVDLQSDPDTDEGIARSFLASGVAASLTGGRGDLPAGPGRPLIVLQVVDANQLSLSLRLTRELCARPLPLLVVITQYDVLRGEGRDLDIALLERGTARPGAGGQLRDPRPGTGCCAPPFTSWRTPMPPAPARSTSTPRTSAAAPCAAPPLRTSCSGGAGSAPRVWTPSSCTRRWGRSSSCS